MNIKNYFENTAPQYWAKGLPAIPLRDRNKMPVLNQWSRFCREMPSEIEQTHWLASYPNGNVGLALGPQSKVCMIDLDDDEYVEMIVAILPKTPWVRYGKKGMQLAYRFEGQKNFKLRGEDGGMILEFLGQGNQSVVAGVHPDCKACNTKNAIGPDHLCANCGAEPTYYRSDTHLWEVIDQLPELGEDIEDKLRALLGAKGVSLGAGGRSSPLDIIPAGERDVQMIRHAGYLARVVMGIDKSARYSLAEAVAQIHTWVEHFTAKVSGDAMDPAKGVAKLLEFLVKDLEKGRTLPEGWDAGLSDEWREHPTIKAMAEMNQVARWTLVRARSWLSGKIAENPTDDDWALARVTELVHAVAKDENFSKFEMAALCTFIIGRCGKTLGLKKSDLMTMWKEAQKEGDIGEAETQAKVARQVLEDLQREGEIRFDNGQFWQWNGSCFSIIRRETIYNYIANTVTGSNLVKTHNGYGQVISILENFCAAPLATDAEVGINFANGFLGVDLQLVDHDPKYGATFTMPFEYKTGGRCDRWIAFLDSCWGHEPDYEERVMALQEMFAATMFKIATRYQKAFLLLGKAGTGKTQVLNVLRALMPKDAVAELGPDKWGERFGLTDLVGKAANICGELPENGRITGNVFKQIVEGTPVGAEFKGKDRFVFTPLCAHWFASNYFPQSSDSTRGFTRRWHILDFGRVVPDSEKIDGLAELIVAEEREAIAAWALEGLRRIMTNRDYTQPECHVRRHEQMRRMNNSVIGFLQGTKGVRKGEGEILVSELYDMYAFYQRDVGRGSPVTLERFAFMLEDLDYEVEQRLDVAGMPELWVKGIRKA